MYKLYFLFLGNTRLLFLTNEELRSRYICAAHFHTSSIRKVNIRSRLIGPAVPINYQDLELGEGTPGTSNADNINLESAQADIATENGIFFIIIHCTYLPGTLFHI